MNNPRIDLLRMLTKRLERLSVDSIWARRANGLRGSLVKALSAADEGTPPDAGHLDLLIEHSFTLLSKAAREIPDHESILWQKIKTEK
jgi:hypothetical protein